MATPADMSERARLRHRVVVAVAGAVLAIYALRAVTDAGGNDLQSIFDDFVYNGLLVIAAGGCVLRAALYREERPAWLLLGVGMVAWATGDIYYTLADPEFPSLSDVGYLLFYPASYATLWLLVRRRIPHFDRGLFVDGLIAALAVAAMAAALVFEPIHDSSTGSSAAVAVNLAYPLADMLLISIAVGVMALTGWRPGRTWIFIALGLAVSAVADGWYLYKIATETYVEGTLLDALWPASMLLIAYAAWQPAEQVKAARLEGWRVFALPSAFGSLGIALLVRDHFERLNDLALILSGLVLLAVILRMTLLFRQNIEMLAQSRREALTDSLTGLGNRRSLMADLREQMAAATMANPRVLVVYDLDGFKQYNDTFGHPAGDALLARLGTKLAAAVAPYGSAYRMGGDEFCALVRAEGPGIEAIAAATDAALTERGEGFEVTASQGRVLLPLEAEDVTFALQVADGRMYLNKGGKRSSPRRQTRDVLLQALRERTPELDVHLHGVAELAHRVGTALGVSPEDLDELTRAAELHDVGKMAIPDGILDKPGALDDDEWAFMRRHTIFGERILAAAPALLPVAKLVRSSHEHYDGSGYPDGLAGEAIPLGSRIILVCDAYHAMVSDRPYAEAMSHGEALRELKRHAAGQFDPQVVKVFCQVIAGGPGVPEEEPSGARESAPGGR